MDNRLHWYEAIADCERRGEPYVLVTVLGVTGSVPREPSSKMVITAEHCYDTIGGGHLEHRITLQARQALARQDYTSHLAHFPLGASLGQCCGGSVSVLFEAMPGSSQRLVIFGAGHVAKALITIVGQLPWQVTWIDQRREEFPQHMPANVRMHCTDDPVAEALELCRGAQVLILTHNHSLDFELCRTLLAAEQKDKPAGIGLIGSETKAQRFRHRLSHRGFSEAAIGVIRSPVGLASVPGKRPMEVAVSIVAELLALSPPVPEQNPRRGISWSTLKTLITETDPKLQSEIAVESESQEPIQNKNSSHES